MMAESATSSIRRSLPSNQAPPRSRQRRRKPRSTQPSRGSQAGSPNSAMMRPPPPCQPQASPVGDHGAAEVAPALEAHAAPVAETAVAEAEAALADAEIAE